LEKVVISICNSSSKVGIGPTNVATGAVDRLEKRIDTAIRPNILQLSFV
jgi:hypothetical protein